jgi:hypothetical protein
MTVDVPDAVKRGQVFKVVVRQTRDTAARRPPSPPGLHSAENETLPAVSQRDLIRWRRVVGSFQLTIPVKTKSELLPIEERLLSVLRWIAQRMSPSDRWYPIFQRYLANVGGRVTDLGGDPTQISPSPTGEGQGEGKPPKPEDRLCFTGKIAGLIFDRFGDFEGFLLDSEEGEREFYSREKEIEELAERAWRERLRITVCAERHSPRRPETIIIREPPAPFWH